MSEGHRFNSDGNFPYPDHFVLDVTSMPPEDAARRIVERFALA